MTATVEIFAGDFSRLIEAKSKTKLCDIGNKLLLEQPFDRH